MEDGEKIHEKIGHACSVARERQVLLKVFDSLNSGLGRMGEARSNERCGRMVGKEVEITLDVEADLPAESS
jgi:hypothetical protein